MKNLKKHLFFAGIFLASNVKAQIVVDHVDLTGPSNVSYCDISTMNWTAYTPLVDYQSGHPNDDGNDWRYVFKLWSNGQVVATKTENEYGIWENIQNDFNFVSGPYQVSLQIQVKFALFWTNSGSQLWSNGINLNLFGNVGQYNAANTSNRMVSGDFDRDGKLDDIASFYNYTSTTTALHVWLSNGSALNYQGDNGWWYGTSFDASKITGRVVSGDFDRDGFKDDIAAVYDYGNNLSKILVWSSNGNSMVYTGVWWASQSGALGYDANKITGRVLSGDFDKDGYEDDLCFFYDYSNSSTNAHVFTSTGTAFNSAGTWYTSGVGNLTASSLNYKLVSGDFDRDGYKNDITGFYAYTGAQTKAFVWKSNGVSFLSPQTWYDSGVGNFDGNQITGKVVSGDFDHDGFKDDITTFYNFPSSQTKAFVWRSTGTSFSSGQTWYDSGVGNFSANQTNGKVVSGDFDNDGFFGDITALYDYGNLSTRTFEWRSNVNSFASPIKTWEVCNIASNINMNENYESSSSSNLKDLEIEIYPNPSEGIFTINNSKNSISKVEVFSLTGILIHSTIINEESKITIDLTNSPTGVYLVKCYNDNEIIIKQVVIQ